MLRNSNGKLGFQISRARSGLRSDEVISQHFLNLDIGFPVDRLRTAIRNCLAGRAEHEQVTYPAVNRRGRPVECTVSPSQLVGSGTTRGVILVMDAVLRDPAPAPDQAKPDAVS